MIKRLISCGLAFAFIGGVSFAAEMPGNNSVPMSNILQTLQNKGYKVVQEVKFEDGRYHVKAINAQGIETDVQVSESGEIANPKDAQMGLTALEAIQKVESAGYKNVYQIEVESDKYEIKAHDKEGKEVTLKVNNKTGEISKGWF